MLRYPQPTGHVSNWKLSNLDPVHTLNPKPTKPTKPLKLSKPLTPLLSTLNPKPTKPTKPLKLSKLTPNPSTLNSQP